MSELAEGPDTRVIGRRPSRTAGATAVIHPGGSLRDEEVVKAADEHGMAMVVCGIRHFKH